MTDIAQSVRELRTVENLIRETRRELEHVHHPAVPYLGLVVRGEITPCDTSHVDALAFMRKIMPLIGDNGTMWREDFFCLLRDTLAAGVNPEIATNAN